MTKFQRALLFLFSALIAVQSSYSDSIADIRLKLFFLAILLFWALSPKHWFSKQIPITSKSDQLAVLIALLKLRSAEITTCYSSIRHFQKAAKEENWILLFMKEFSTVPENPWTDYSEKKKLEDRAFKIFIGHYKFNPFAPLDYYRGRIVDVKIALLAWNSPGIEKLTKLRAFGVMTDAIDELISSYNNLGSRSFNAIFGSNPLKYFSRAAFVKIKHTWSEILTTVKTAIIVKKITSLHCQEKTYLDHLLAEIEALEDLERCLDLVITESTYCPSSPLKKNETLLFDNLNNNLMQ